MKVFVVGYCDISHTYFVHETPSAQFQHTSLMVVSPVVPSVVLSVELSVVLSVVAAGVVLLGVVLGILEQSPM